MTLNQLLEDLRNINKEYEVYYAYQRVYHYTGSNDDKVVITGSVFFLFDDSGMLLDLWGVE